MESSAAAITTASKHIRILKLHPSLSSEVKLLALFACDMYIIMVLLLLITQVSRDVSLNEHIYFTNILCEDFNLWDTTVRLA